MAEMIDGPSYRTCARHGCTDIAIGNMSMYCLAHHKESLKNSGEVRSYQQALMQPASGTIRLNDLMMQGPITASENQYTAGGGLVGSGPRVIKAFDPATHQYIVKLTDGHRQIAFRCDSEEEAKYWIQNRMYAEWAAKEDKVFKLTWSPSTKSWEVSLPGNHNAAFNTLDDAMDYMRAQAVMMIPQRSQDKMLDNKPDDYGGW